MQKFIKLSLYTLALFLPIQTFSVYFIDELGFSIRLSLWKEVVVFCVILAAGFEIVKILFRSTQSSKTKLLQSLPLILVFLSSFVITINSVFFGEFHLNVFALGFRFELYWLWFFAVLATLINLNKGFFDQINLKKYILLGFVPVIFLSLTILALGQNQTFNLLGLQTGSNNSLVSKNPDCHKVDFEVDECRLSGSFSNPNHFAGYLLLILPIIIISLRKKTVIALVSRKLSPTLAIYALALGLNLIFLYQTKARYALLGLFVWLILEFILMLKTRFLQKLIVVTALIIPIFVFLIPVTIGAASQSPNFSLPSFLPTSITKPSSTVEHYRNTAANIEIFTNSPARFFTGFGLGNSGPAAKMEYQNLEKENLLFKLNSGLSFKWYILPHRITIPENWFIQILLNGGLFYFIFYIALLFYPIKSILKFLINGEKPDFRELQVNAAFLAILIGNLFLHLFENQTISLYWTLLWVWSKSAGTNEQE